MLILKAQNKLENGFSFTEVLIVIAVILVLVSAAFPIYSNLQISVQINEASAQIAQTLRLSREQSLAGLNNSRHGVYLQNDRYTLYQGSSFISRDIAYDREIILDKGLSLSWGLSGGGQDINFSKGLGMPQTFGFIVLSHQTKGQRRIEINQWGMVEEK